MHQREQEEIDPEEEAEEVQAEAEVDSGETKRLKPVQRFKPQNSDRIY